MKQTSGYGMYTYTTQMHACTHTHTLFLPTYTYHGCEPHYTVTADSQATFQPVFWGGNELGREKRLDGQHRQSSCLTTERVISSLVAACTVLHCTVT